MLMMELGLVVVVFAMVDFSCAISVIVRSLGTRILTYESIGTELCRVK